MNRFANRFHRNLAERFCPLGWQWSTSGGNHIRWQHPSAGLVFTASSPSDGRALANSIKVFERAMKASQVEGSNAGR